MRIDDKTDVCQDNVEDSGICPYKFKSIFIKLDELINCKICVLTRIVINLTHLTVGNESPHKRWFSFSPLSKYPIKEFFQ